MKTVILTTILLFFVAVGMVPHQSYAQYTYSDSFYNWNYQSPMQQPYYATNYSYTQPQYGWNQNQYISQPVFDNGYIPSFGWNQYQYQYTAPYSYISFDDQWDDRWSSYSSRNNERPRVRTEDADDVESDEAELNGEVDMNDFNNGIVFFVYGQDENAIEDVERDYDEYDEVRDDEEDDDFEVERVDNDLDGDDSYRERVTGLEEDEEYYFVLCVEYEDEDNDERLECGNVESFDTDEDNDNDRPDVDTQSAQNIDDDSARLRGEVDMNDFNDGIAFFVYGENENDVEDVENEDSFDDIDEEGDDLQKVIEDNDVDGSQDIERTVFNLDGNTTIYFRLCVEYEDEDDDEQLECGDVRDFETD
jgi:hypothetical protein